MEIKKIGQLYEMPNSQMDKLMKCQLDELAKWQNGILIKDSLMRWHWTKCKLMK
jgi:hypothetical protein